MAYPGLGTTATDPSTCATARAEAGAIGLWSAKRATFTTGISWSRNATETIIRWSLTRAGLISAELSMAREALAECWLVQMAIRAAVGPDTTFTTRTGMGTSRAWWTTARPW